MTIREDFKLGCDVVNLGIGEIHVSTAGEAISTVLGTCVAVTLHDNDTGIGGMNHFMLPGPGLDPFMDKTEQGRYGTSSMELLCRRFEQVGGRLTAARAKVFGGGSRPDSLDKMDWAIGRRNIETALTFLEERLIPVEASDLGENIARRVVLRTESGRVFVRRVPWGKQGDMHEEQG